MTIPQIQISQQAGRIGITAERGQQHLEQPKASFKMRQVDAQIDVSQTQATLQVKQDRAFDAVGLGGNLKVMSRIYSQANQIALQGIARRISDGDRMADLAHSGGVNPIPALSKDWRDKKITYPVNGQASFLNVDVNITPGKLQIDARPGYVDLQVNVNPPINNYKRGKFDVYWLQRPEVQIVPPRIDATV